MRAVSISSGRLIVPVYNGVLGSRTSCSLFSRRAQGRGMDGYCRVLRQEGCWFGLNKTLFKTK